MTCSTWWGLAPRVSYKTSHERAAPIGRRACGLTRVLQLGGELGGGQSHTGCEKRLPPQPLLCSEKGWDNAVPTVCLESCTGCRGGSWGDSRVKRLLLEGECSSELLGVWGASPEGDGNSSSFCPFRLSLAGLMRGLRWRREPELEAMEGAGDGSGEVGQLPDSTDK